MFKRFIDHIKRWNEWRKHNINNVWHKLLVLFGIIKSPSFYIFMLKDEWVDLQNAVKKGIEDGANNPLSWFSSDEFLELQKKVKDDIEFMTEMEHDNFDLRYEINHLSESPLAFENVKQLSPEDFDALSYPRKVIIERDDPDGGTEIPRPS